MGNEAGAPFVYVVVLNWNGAGVIGECLESLLAMDYPDFRVAVVDNASTDDSPGMVERDYPQVELLRMEENLMYAGGNNVGIERALKLGAGAVLLVNNDTVADRGLLAHLVRGLRDNPGAGAAGPKILYNDKKDVIWSAGGKVIVPLGFVHHIGIRKPDSGRYNRERVVDYLTGCCVLMRSEVIREIGPLDTAYHIYSEDVDWCLRARGAGWSSLYVPGARLRHKVSYSSGGGLTPFKAYYKMRSNVLIFRRFARPVHWLTWPLATAGYAAAMACVQAARGRPRVAREFLRGWADGFFSPGAEGMAGNKKEPK